MKLSQKEKVARLEKRKKQEIAHACEKFEEHKTFFTFEKRFLVEAKYNEFIRIARKRK